MQARIIEISDSHLYLEIDEQLRFRSQYVAGSDVARLSKYDWIDFRFSNDRNGPQVIVQNVIRRGDQPMIGRQSI